MLVERADGRGTDRLLHRRLAVVDADELQIAAIGQPGDAVEGPATGMPSASGDRQSEGVGEVGGSRVRIGAGDDEMIDAPDHGADPSSIR